MGNRFVTRPEIAGDFGMVASSHWLASAAGMSVLEQGGNAFDAAVAAGFVLQVVAPHLNGLGGEVPIIGYDAASGETFVVDGQGPAPAAADLGAFRALGLDLVPGTGLLAACVPGAFGAWLLLLRRHGRLRLHQVLDYAIGYAEGGHPLGSAASAAIAGVEQVFRDDWPSSAAVYLAGGRPAPGSRLANPDLAATYRRLLAEAESAGGDRDAQIEAARVAFYRGFVAEQLAGYLATAEVADVTGGRHRGLLGYDDLAGWEASIEAPLTADYRGYTVCKTGPWGQGPVFLQQLRLLEGVDLDAMGVGSVEWVHTIVEGMKLSFADREAFYGDPRFVDVPLVELLSAEYADSRRGLIGPGAAVDFRPGSPGGRSPVPPPLFHQGRGAGGAGEPTRLGEADSPLPAPDEPLGGDTVHVDVADRFGNLVSATPSGGWLQSSPVVPGLGFCLGTRAQMFWLRPGLANSLEPGKRPRTTLSPSLAFRRGEPYLAFGTPGGDQQDQWSLLFFLNHSHGGLSLQEAIEVPAFHSLHFPSSFYPREFHPAGLEVEDRLGEEVIAGLRRRGHDVAVRPSWSLGRVTAVSRGSAGFLYAAADPRGMQSYAHGR